MVCQLNLDIIHLPVDSKQHILTRIESAFDSYPCRPLSCEYYLITVCKSTHGTDPEKIKIQYAASHMGNKISIRYMESWAF